MGHAQKKERFMEFPMTELDGADLADAAELFGADMPNPSEYLSARQSARIRLHQSRHH